MDAGGPRRTSRRRAQKLVAQYARYRPFPDLAVNGKLTLGENIADLAGLAAAYDAWRASLGGSRRPAVDGLDGDQQFFVGLRADLADQDARARAAPAAPRPTATRPAAYRALTVRNLDPWYAAFDVEARAGALPARRRSACGSGRHGHAAQSHHERDVAPTSAEMATNAIWPAGARRELPRALPCGRSEPARSRARWPRAEDKAAGAHERLDALPVASGAVAEEDQCGSPDHGAEHVVEDERTVADARHPGRARDECAYSRREPAERDRPARVAVAERLPPSRAPALCEARGAGASSCPSASRPRSRPCRPPLRPGSRLLARSQERFCPATRARRRSRVAASPGTMMPRKADASSAGKRKITNSASQPGTDSSHSSAPPTRTMNSFYGFP